MPVEQLVSSGVNVKDLVLDPIGKAEMPLTFAFGLEPSPQVRAQMLEDYPTLRDSNHFQNYCLITFNYYVAMKYLFPEMHFEKDEKVWENIRREGGKWGLFSHEDGNERGTNAKLFNPVKFRETWGEKGRQTSSVKEELR